MNADKVKILADGGDGGNRKTSKEALAAMVEALLDLAGLGDEFFMGPEEADTRRLNIWPGQSADGRKWSKKIGKAAAPFDGSADVRVHLIELIVKAKVALTIETITRAQVAVMPVTAKDAEFAGRVHLILTHLLKNVWRGRGRRQAKLMANWVFTDGFAALHSHYDRMVTVRNESVDLGTLVDDFVMAAMAEGRVESEEDADVLAQTIAGHILGDTPEDRAEALEILEARFPMLSTKRLRHMLRELRKDGVTKAPVTLLGREGPKPTALRLKEDLLFDPDCDDIQDAPYLFQVEHLTLGQVKHRAELEDWDETWLESLIGDGESNGARGRFRVNLRTQSRRGLEEEADRDRYEVVTCYRKAVDDEGRTLVIRSVFHAELEGTATGDVLLEDAYGDYPVVVFCREVLSSRLMDSRGWPDVAGPNQALVKWLRDLAVNVTALKTLPPVRVPHNRRASEVLIAPLAEIREKRPGEVSAFTDFQYPREAIDVAKLLEDAMLGLAAMPTEALNPMLTELMQLDETKDILAGMEEFYGIVITQLLHNMSEERLEMLAGGPVRDLLPEELAMRANVVVSFDPRHLDKEFVKGWLETLNNLILPNDQKGIILRDKLTRLTMRMWDPSLGDEVIQDSEVAADSEMKEEQDAIARMLAGFPAELLEFDSGADFQARMQVYQQWKEGNAQLIDGQPDSVLEQLLAHEQNLTQMLTQMENVGIGRTGVSAGGGADGRG
jgi:hypothetical protein